MSCVFAAEYGQPEKPGMKVPDSCVKTIRILRVTESVNPGLGKRWGRDIVKGSMVLGIRIDSG